MGNSLKEIERKRKRGKREKGREREGGGFCNNAATDTRKPFGNEPRDSDLAPALWRCPTHTADKTYFLPR